MWKPKRDPARLHNLVARQSTVGAGFSGRTGSRHQPCVGGDLFEARTVGGAGLPQRYGTTQAAHQSPGAVFRGHRSGPNPRALSGRRLRRCAEFSIPGSATRSGNRTKASLRSTTVSIRKNASPLRLRLKVEINSREHFTVFGRKTIPFAVDSRWFQGSTKIVTYELEELLGTKLRALYQRKKGRDLFDLAAALEATTVNPARIVEAFTAYMKNEGKHVTRALFERNLAEK